MEVGKKERVIVSESEHCVASSVTVKTIAVSVLLIFPLLVPPTGLPLGIVTQLKLTLFDELKIVRLIFEVSIGFPPQIVIVSIV